MDKTARRQQILDAAVRVFARRGFAASRIEDVAAEAGIAKGSVYMYFGSREEILRAAFEALASAMDRLLEGALSGTGPALARLDALIRDVLASIAAAPDLARVLLDLWGSGRDGDGLPLDMAETYGRYRAAVAALLAQAAAEGEARPGVGEAEATVIVGAIEGCVLQWLIDPRVPIGELAEPLAAVCLHGVRGRDA
ncbi:TetR/AcrR family transcriptional regulator [Thermocatellispora tengchongensis]